MDDPNDPGMEGLLTPEYKTMALVRQVQEKHEERNCFQNFLNMKEEINRMHAEAEKQERERQEHENLLDKEFNKRKRQEDLRKLKMERQLLSERKAQLDEQASLDRAKELEEIRRQTAAQKAAKEEEIRQKKRIRQLELQQKKERLLEEKRLLLEQQEEERQRELRRVETHANELRLQTERRSQIMEAKRLRVHPNKADMLRNDALLPNRSKLSSPNSRTPRSASLVVSPVIKSPFETTPRSGRTPNVAGQTPTGSLSGRFNEPDRVQSSPDASNTRNLASQTNYSDAPSPWSQRDDGESLEY